MFALAGDVVREVSVTLAVVAVSGDGVGRLYVLVARIHLAHLYQLVPGARPPLLSVPDAIPDDVEDDVEKHRVEAETHQKVEGHEPEDAGAGVVDHAEVAGDRDELVVDPDGGEQRERVEEAVDEVPDPGLQLEDDQTAEEEIRDEDEEGEDERRYQLGLLRPLLNVFRLVLEVVVLVQVVDVEVVRLVQGSLLQLLLELAPLSLEPHPLLLLLHEDLVVAAVAALAAEAAAHGVGEAVLGELGQDQADVAHIDEEDGEPDEGVDDGDELGALGLGVVRVGVPWNIGEGFS